MKKYIYFFSILLCMLGCQYNGNVLPLPKLDVSSIEDDPALTYVKNESVAQENPNLFFWQETVKIAEKYYTDSYSQLWNATKQFQTLLASTNTHSLDITEEKFPTFLKSIIEENLQDERHQETIRFIPILLYAIENNVLQGWQLSHTQIPEFQTTWQELCQAERYFLHTGILVAELRQKLSMHPHIRTNYPDLCNKIDSLPTQNHLESRRKLCQVLFSAYQQLMLQNHTLQLPQNTIHD